MSLLPRGTGVALVTPFQNGQVDYETLAALVDYTIDGGVDYIVALGSTGEAVTCTSAECRRIFDTILATTDGRVPVVAGMFGDNDTNYLASKIADYNFDGFAAIMSSTPHYNKPSQEGIYQHYLRLAETAPLPILLYNVPSRTGSNMLPETTLRLAELGAEKFLGVKEASGNIEQVDELIRNRPSDFMILSGDDALTVPLIALGAEGAVSVVANALPEVFSEMVRTALDNDYATARDLHARMADIHPLLYREGNPTGLKAMMHLLDLCTDEVRLPLVAMSDDGRSALEEVLRKNLASTF